MMTGYFPYLSLIFPHRNLTGAADFGRDAEKRQDGEGGFLESAQRNAADRKERWGAAFSPCPRSGNAGNPFATPPKPPIERVI